MGGGGRGLFRGSGERGIGPNDHTGKPVGMYIRGRKEDRSKLGRGCYDETGQGQVTLDGIAERRHFWPAPVPSAKTIHLPSVARRQCDAWTTHNSPRQTLTCTRRSVLSRTIFRLRSLSASSSTAILSVLSDCPCADRKTATHKIRLISTPSCRGPRSRSSIILTVHADGPNTYP